MTSNSENEGSACSPLPSGVSDDAAAAVSSIDEQQEEANNHGEAARMLCPVCRAEKEENEFKILRCSHAVCKFCLSRWVGRQEHHGIYLPTCPACRTHVQLDEVAELLREETHHQTPSFDHLLEELSVLRPFRMVDSKKIFYFGENPVYLVRGEMSGIHWVDIHMTLIGFRADTLDAAKKILKANVDMGISTPIPFWFAMGEANEVLFLERLDWHYFTAAVLNDHIARCISGMSAALVAEGLERELEQEVTSEEG